LVVVEVKSIVRGEQPEELPLSLVVKLAVTGGFTVIVFSLMLVHPPVLDTLSLIVIGKGVLVVVGLV